MNTKQIIKKAMKENPDIRLVLEISARARDMESKELPREMGASTEVVAIPCNPQTPVSWGVLSH
jgi:hypothetical protein